MMKATGTVLLVCSIAFVVGGWVLADASGEGDIDDLPTLDSLETHASIKAPKLSLPNDLVTVPRVSPGEYFVPPRIEDLDNGKYADTVRWGRDIFTNTHKYAARYVGNALDCSSCHLQEGRKPFAAPLWAAYPMYPAYSEKSKQVVTFQESIQKCFRVNLNGIAPTLDAPEMDALVTYAQWLSSTVPVDTLLPGRGFSRIDKSKDPSGNNGSVIYKQYCAICHGDDLLGKKFTNRTGYQFPPLAGPDSYSMGSGMNKVKTCASFVKANMPPGQPDRLGNDQALEVCVFLFLQDRPWDPRKGLMKNVFLRRMDG